MNTKRITTENASIKTTSVDVRVMSISGKQMTLSVFRQLKEEQVIDPKTLQLLGTTWGTVNYFWGDDAKYSDGYLHVVWQSGNELRRALVPKDLYRFKKWRECQDALDRYFVAVVIFGIIEGVITGDIQKSYSSTVEGRRLRVDVAGYEIPYEMKNHLETILKWPLSDPDNHEKKWLADAIAKASASLKSYANSSGYIGDTYEGVKAVAINAAIELNDAESRWSTLLQSLEQLDHLFIAV